MQTTTLLILTCCCLVLKSSSGFAFSSFSALFMTGPAKDVQPLPPSKVLVTGAAGRTGRLVLEQLLQNDRFDPVALVRSERSGRQLIKTTPDCGLERVVVCDVVKDPFFPPLDRVDSMIICTSAVPILSKVSLLKALVKAPLNVAKGHPAIDFRSMQFKFKNGQYPELVDYEGAVAQIDLAKKLGVKRIVIVSSMGGTDPNNFLNKVGKKSDGSGNGDILLWKRKAERYLVNSGMSYTIIHPGGLIDDNENNKEEELVLDVDDKLMEQHGDGSSAKRSISRANVASLCVASLDMTENVSLDCISTHNKNPISAAHALEAFLKTKQTTNYEL